MADAKISALPAVTVPAMTDEIPVNQGGATKKVSRTLMFTDPKFGNFADLSGIAPPAAPAAGTVRLFAALRANKAHLSQIGPTGLVSPFQIALWDNAIYWWSPTNVAAGLWVGTVGATAGTFTTSLPTTTNTFTTIRRSSYKTVITTTNQQVGQWSSEKIFFRGNAAGQGGFFFFCRFGIGNWTAGDRLFVGLTAGTIAALVTVQPNTLLNTCGFLIDAADTAITFASNDGTGTATKTAIAGQPALASNQGYDAYIFMPPNSSTIYYRLDNINTGANIVDSSVSADLPVANTMMSAAAVMGNAANTPVNSAGIDISDIYIETDK